MGRTSISLKPKFQNAKEPAPRTIETSKSNMKGNRIKKLCTSTKQRRSQNESTLNDRFLGRSLE